jgi:uncharacterized membrane protein (DUF485 family)
MDLTNLHVENLREALRQIQRYIVIAIGASVALAFMELGLATRIGEGVTVSGLPVSVTAPAAKLVLTAIYISATWLALGIGYELERLARRIEDTATRQAALGYPSAITSPDPWVRVLGTILPGLIFLVFTVAFWRHTKDREVMLLFLGIGFGCLPCLALLWLVKGVLDGRTTAQGAAKA